MPSVSAKQHRYMEGVAHGMKPKKGGDLSVKVAKEFVAADKGKKFADGGTVYEKPTYWQAVKDRVKELLPQKGTDVLYHGAAKKAADDLSGRQKQIDDAVDKASMARGGSVSKKRKRPSGGVSPAMLAAMSGPPPGAGGPPGMPPGGGGPPMGMKKGGRVAAPLRGKQLSSTKTENKGGQSKIGGGVERKGSTLTRVISMKGSGIAEKGTSPTKRFASGGSVRGGGIESKGKTRGRFV